MAEANAFAGAAAVYWFEVFPQVKHEVARLRDLAARIPDRRLARLAQETQAHERGNLEGSAVFALLAPRARRADVIRAAVTFQALYDFLDTLAELPVADPVANGRCLHRALVAALDPACPAAPYLAHSGFACDGGYVEALVRACHVALGALPSYPAIAAQVQQAAARMLAYQSFNHGQADPARAALRGWALALTPPGSGLEWWETAAGAASSLGVFALLAAAAQDRSEEAQALAATEAYFPWVGALHVLLDSLVDHELDRVSGEHSLVDHYADAGVAAARLGAIAAESACRLEQLAQGRRHGLILAAMAGFYLARPAAWSPFAAPAAARVVAALGPAARPAAAILRARSAVQNGILKVK